MTLAGQEVWREYRKEVLERTADFSGLFAQLKKQQPQSSGWTAALCPFHNDQNPSFSYNPKTGHWKCFSGCGKGSAFDFLMHTNGGSFKDTLLQMGDKAGVPRPFKNGALQKKPSEALVEKFKQALWNQSSALAYLRNGRGLSDDTLRKYEIGWSARLQRVTIPVRDPDGTLANIRFYSRRKQPKMLNLKGFGHKARLYGADELLAKEKAGQPTKQIILCEGEWDRLLLQQHGFTALTSTHGCGTFQKDWVPFLKDKEVVILFDCDGPGRKSVQDVILPMLKDAGTTWVKNVVLPLAGTKDSKDVTDFFQAGFATSADLQNLIRETPIVDFANLAMPEKPAPLKKKTTTTLGLKIVEYILNEDEVNALFFRIFGVINDTAQFYNQNGNIVFIRPGQGTAILTHENLNGILSSFLEIAFMAAESEKKKDSTSTDDQIVTYILRRYGVLPSPLIAPFLSSPLVASQFPALREYTRAPVFDDQWNFVSTPGYHMGGIYYDGPEIAPADGTALLEKTLADFCWKSAADKINFIGILITALTMNHWIGRHPLVVFSSNKPGAGKSLLGRLLAVLIEGKNPVTLSFNANDEELEKNLAARIDAGDRIVIIDNARKPHRVSEISSMVLERSISDARLAFRRLGTNSSISRDNDVAFCLTMNHAELGKDLRRRSLPVNLEQQANVRSVRFPIGDLIGFALEHRLEILAELAGMVERWVKAGKPQVEDPATHSISQTWAGTIDSILRLSGYNGFLSNFDESEHAFDPNYSLMVEICEVHKDQLPQTAGEWADLLVDDELESKLKDRKGNPKTKRSQSTIIGNLFNQYLDTPIQLDSGTYSIVREDMGKGHSPKYSFERTQNPEEQDG